MLVLELKLLTEALTSSMYVQISVIRDYFIQNINEYIEKKSGLQVEIGKDF